MRPNLDTFILVRTHLSMTDMLGHRHPDDEMVVSSFAQHCGGAWDAIPTHDVFLVWAEPAIWGIGLPHDLPFRPTYPFDPRLGLIWMCVQVFAAHLPENASRAQAYLTNQDGDAVQNNTGNSQDPHMEMAPLPQGASGGLKQRKPANASSESAERH